MEYVEAQNLAFRIVCKKKKANDATNVNVRHDVKRESKTTRPRFSYKNLRNSSHAVHVVIIRGAEYSG